MTNKDKLHSMRGTLHLSVYDQHGSEISRMQQSNLIVAGAHAITSEALAGAPNAQITKVAAGTNGTPPSDSDTQIVDPAVVDIQSVEYPQPGTVRFNFTFGYNDAVNKSIREFGLLSTDGRLFSRKVRKPIEKSKYMSIVGTWEITI